LAFGLIPFGTGKPRASEEVAGWFGVELFYSTRSVILNEPFLNAVTNPQDVSMLTERIAESLENILPAISLSWVMEVIVFICFFGFGLGVNSL
jgi:hypothetical protein